MGGEVLSAPPATAGAPLHTGNGKSAASTLGSGRLRLQAPLGGSTWLATIDGEPVAARRAVGTFAASADVPVAESTAATLPNGQRAERVVHYLGTAQLDQSLWWVSPYVPGIDLERLLGTTTLTPTQGVYIAAHVLLALNELHQSGHTYNKLGARDVLIGDSGAIRLTGWSPLLDGTDPAAPSRDLVAARTICYELAHNADRPAARKGVAAELLSRLANIDTTDPSTQAASLLRMVDQCVDLPLDDATIRMQLAMLVSAAARITHTVTPVSRAETTQEIPVVKAAPEFAAVDGRHRDHPRRSRLLLVAGLAVVLAASAYVFARHPIASLADRLLNGNTSSSSSPPPRHAPANHHRGHGATRAHARSHKPLGPPAAGPIRSVHARPVGACHPNSVCPVQVSVTVRPGSSSRHVSWTLVTIDRCTARRRAFRGGVMTISAGSTFAYDTRPVRLARRHPSYVVAVTHAPAHAASRRVAVPAGQHPSC
jgi:hypothetical protein